MPVWYGDDDADAVSFMESATNAAALAHLRDYYLLHAGAVAVGGQGVILPAASGSGKTSLVAALISAGCQYFSDEVAALDPSTHHLLPFAKSLYVREGARGMLLPLHPSLGRARPRVRRVEGEKIWLLPPPAESLPASSVPVRFVILPEYRSGARTTVATLARSMVLKRLVDQSFNLREHRSRGIGALVQVLAAADCYSLTFSSVLEAADVMTDIVMKRCSGTREPISPTH